MNHPQPAAPGADARHQEPPPDERDLGLRPPDASRTVPANRSEAQEPEAATEDPVPPAETTEPG